jgi:glycosyltransferase involved in cell wall biosynthesis
MLGDRETGNETYVRGLLTGLSSIADVEVAAAVQPGRDDGQATPDVKVGSAIAGARIDWLQLPSRASWRRLARDLAALGRSWGADVIHSTYLAPYGARCPVVVSVHDVSFRRYPEYFSWRDRALFAALLPSSLRRAAAILALSSHGRAELQRFYPSLHTPVHVVPAAPSAAFRPLDTAYVATRLAKLDLPERFLLAVGNLQPRKNLSRLIEAYDQLRRAHHGVGLVLVGPRGFRSSWVEETIAARGLEDSVRLLGYVHEEDLAALYNASVGLVYPSVYEGFGLPAIEAMACGRPVIAASTSSLPEVTGDAALLVDPFDTGALHRAMARVVTDEKLAGELGARGQARAAQFSWRRTAEAALTAFRAASAGGRASSSQA